MTQTTEYDGSPITNAIKVGPDGQPGYSLTSQLGTPGYSTVVVDDPDGSLDFQTWRDWTVDESDCLAYTRVFSGMIYAKDIIRGPYRDGPGRQWILSIVDLNGLLALRIISGSDGKRPAEDDVTRAAWIIASDYLDGVVFDNGKVATDPRTGALDDSDYRGQYPSDVLVSIAGPVARNAYVYWDDVAGQPSLYYGDAEVALDAATIGFSNVESDVDNVAVFFPSIDANTNKNGEDRYGGLYLGTRAGNIYRQSSTTIADMGGRIRDVAVHTDRIGRAATAEEHATRLLAYHQDDLDEITFSADLPSSVVNLARPGMSMTVRFSHVPGYESGTTVLVRSTVVQQLQAGLYRVQYRVAPNPLAPLGEGGGSPGDFPHLNPAILDYASKTEPTGTSSFDLPELTTAGAPLQLIAFVSKHPRADHTDPAGWTRRASVGYTDVSDRRHTMLDQLVTVAAPPYGGTLTCSGTNYWTASVLAFNAGTGPTGVSGLQHDFHGSGGTANPTVTATLSGATTAGKRLVGFVTRAKNAVVGDTDGFTWPAGWDVLVHLDSVVVGSNGVVGESEMAIKTCTGAETTIAVEVFGNEVVNTTLLIGEYDLEDPTADPPAPNQPVPPTAPTGDVDGSNTDYTAPFPFADETLFVTHDGIDVTPYVATYDGAAGTFSLDYAPSFGSTILVRLRGR